jgi:hypothetical protein
MVSSFGIFMLVELMDLYPRFVDCQIGEPGIDPPARVVVTDAVFFHVQRFMRMAAEDALRLMMSGKSDCARRDLGRHAQPPRIQSVDRARDGFALEVQLLQLQIQRRAQPAQPQIVELESIELVAVDGDMAHAAIVPFVVLVHAHADQMRHDVGQTMVVIPFHPNHFDATLRVRQLADVAEKLPVILVEAGEVEVGEDIAQQDEPVKTALFEQIGSFPRMARFRAEVQIRKDQRVVGMRIHGLVVARDC